MSKSTEGSKGLLLEEGELLKISNRESAKANGSASAVEVGEVEGMSKRLASLPSKMSTSSLDMKGIESVGVEDAKGCIGMGETDGTSLAASMVLATSKSREEGLEVGIGDEPWIEGLPVSSVEESTAIGNGVAVGVSIKDGERARLEGKVD